MKNQPFLIPVGGLVSGILFSESFRLGSFNDLKWIILLVFILISVVLIYRKNIFSLLIFTIFSIYGFAFSNHYNQWKPLPEKLIGQETNICLKINETFRSSEKFRKYSAEIHSINSSNINKTSVLLYWSKRNPELFTDDKILIQSKLQTLQKPLNPYQFDYSKYLERKNIHYVIFQNKSYERIEESGSLPHLSSIFKRKIHNRMIEFGFQKPTADLVSAMLLGDRTEMNPAIENDFRRTGVVHLLAISGLHVMMVFGIFMLLLYPVIYLKDGKNIRITLCLLLIWGFVAFVDFRPPVFRSGLMISIYYITILLKRKPNIYHTLLLSAIILLLYNPNFLFDPGFLLSYSAVFFIVYFNPVYQRLLKPKTKFSRNVVGFLGTTISAQLGTLPFSVFFFNQTSALFLFGNVVMITASYLMVGGGMLTVLLTAFGIDLQWWQKAFDFFINACNSYIHWLSKFDDLVFDRISLTGIELFLLIIGILLLRWVFLRPKAKHLFVLLSLIFIFEGQRIYRINRMLKKEEIIVFHQNKNTVIGVRKAMFMDVYLADLSDSTQIEKYIITPYNIHQKIRKTRFLSLNSTARGFYIKTPDFIELSGKRLILLSENSNVNLRQGDFVLFRNNPKIDSIPPGVNLIFDGSNYPDYFKQINHPNIWNTRTEGALIIEQK